MHFRLLFALFAVAVQLVAGSYAPTYQSPGAINEIIQEASGGSQSAIQSLSANAEPRPTPSEAAGLGTAAAQVQALNNNAVYNNYGNSDIIAESLATSNMAENIRHGTVNMVPPNVVEQDVHRSLLVPSGPNNHQVIATNPLPPIIVTQPGAPPAQVSSGPAAIVKAAPVIYKIRPSVIYQQEVINKIPTPLSLNPVYVKVYKPSQSVEVPTAPVVQESYKNSPAYGAPAQAPAYGSALSAYSQQAPAYNVAAPAYGTPSAAYSALSPVYAAPAQGSAYGSTYNAPSYGSVSQGWQP